MALIASHDDRFAATSKGSPTSHGSTYIEMNNLSSL
jgi:hypothetical protein